MGQGADDQAADDQRHSGRPAATLDDVIAAGLYDPAGADAAAQREVVDHLLAAGVSIDEMRAAEQRTGFIASAAGDRTIFRLGERLTAGEVARRAGVPVEQVLRVRLACGLPTDETALLPSWAVEDIAGYAAAAALFGEEPTIAFTRVMGAAAEKVAEAEVALFLSEVDTALTAAGAPPLAWAEANERAAELVGVGVDILTHLLREHLAGAVQRQRLRSSPGEGAVADDLAIGFVDLVGSTAWGRTLPLPDHARALARFESAAWEIANRHEGRVVKLIGDEAMVTAADADALCRIALELCAAVAADAELPPARGAVGTGVLAARDGDYFGPTVNLVARAVKAAPAGEVAVTVEVPAACAAVGSSLRFEPFGEHELRGIGQVVALLLVRDAAG